MAPHLRAILAFIMMSIHHSRATLPLEMEDIPHLLTIYQRSNSHMDLSERIYVCEKRECGLTIDRDLNAALNLAALAR